MTWSIVERGGGYEVTTIDRFGRHASCGVTEDDLRAVEAFVFLHARPNDSIRWPGGMVHNVVALAAA